MRTEQTGGRGSNGPERREYQMSKVDRDSRASSIKFLTKTFSPAPKHEF
jgi:hypothetical protein